MPPTFHFFHVVAISELSHAYLPWWAFFSVYWLPDIPKFTRYHCTLDLSLPQTNPFPRSRKWKDWTDCISRFRIQVTPHNSKKFEKISLNCIEVLFHQFYNIRLALRLVSTKSELYYLVIHYAELFLWTLSKFVLCLTTEYNSFSWQNSTLLVNDIMRCTVFKPTDLLCSIWWSH